MNLSMHRLKNQVQHEIIAMLINSSSPQGCQSSLRWPNIKRTGMLLANRHDLCKSLHAPIGYCYRGARSATMGTDCNGTCHIKTYNAMSSWPRATPKKCRREIATDLTNNQVLRRPEQLQGPLTSSNSICSMGSCLAMVAHRSCLA